MVAITETWLTSNVFNNEILPNQYIIYHNDRRSRGGGVLIAVRTHIISKLLPSPTNLEMLTVELKLPKRLILCVVYLPPDPTSSQIRSLSDHISQFQQSHSVVLLGDFNLPHINWETMCGNCRASEDLCDMTFELNLVQLITYPTHIHGNILDLILTNDEDLITNVSVNSPECSQISSDHFPISFSINQNCLPLHNTTTLQAYDYSKADFTSMNDFILNSNIADCLTCDDVESTWSTIKSVISEAMSLFIPKFQLRSNQYPKWFSRDIRHQLKCLHTLRRTHKRSPTPHNTAKLRLADEHFQQSVALAKSNYESSLINSYAESSNPAIYHYIRSYTKSGTIPPTVHLDDTTASSDASRASLFNRYFHSVFTAPTSSEQTIPSLHPDQVNSLTFTEDEVYYVLCQLDPNKATGIDKISPKVLKNCAFSLTRPLCHLFNLSLSTGSIPEEWKIHLIVLVYKSEDRSSVKNYRPISLLSNTSKVLETLVYNNIINHTLSHITNCQFGFLPGRSTTQQLLLYLNSIHQVTTQGHQIDSIYLDFRKAFDSVPHMKLLNKLKSCGISGNLHKWFSSYLHNRLQCVRICNSISNLLPVLSGVPQGSTLGPLLFLLYINDLPSVIKFSSIFQFADDTKLSKSIAVSSDQLCLQEDLNHLFTWSVNNDFRFSVPKCIHLRFNSKFTTTYSIDGCPLPQLLSHRDLGLQLSSDMSWFKHYQIITAKAYKYLGLLRRVFHSCHSIRARKLLYLTLVRSQLTYCSQLWNPYMIKDTTILEKVQRQATKFILADYVSDYKTRLLRLGILPLMYMLDLYDIMFLVKALQQPSSQFNLYNYISFSSSNTRSSSTNKLNHVRTNSNYARNFYFNRIPRIWNQLPCIDINQSLPVIKATIQNYLWQHFTTNFSPDNPCTYHYCCRCSKCYDSGLTINFTT